LKNKLFRVEFTEEPDVLYVNYTENDDRIDLKDLFYIRSYSMFPIDKLKKKDYLMIQPTFDDTRTWLKFKKKYKNLEFKIKYAYPYKELNNEINIDYFQPNILHLLNKRVNGDAEKKDFSIKQGSLENHLLKECFPDFWKLGKLNNFNRSWNFSDIDNHFKNIDYEEIINQIKFFLNFYKNPIRLTLKSKKNFNLLTV